MAKLEFLQVLYMFILQVAWRRTCICLTVLWKYVCKWTCPFGVQTKPGANCLMSCELFFSVLVLIQGKLTASFYTLYVLFLYTIVNSILWYSYCNCAKRKQWALFEHPSPLLFFCWHSWLLKMLLFLNRRC